MKQNLHIVCFDNPFPPTYGGAIDVFYRIQALAQAGVSITLHCSYKGTLIRSEELESLCHKVYYYPRDLGWRRFFSTLPYAVNGRQNNELLNHLIADNAPILFEGLVDCFYLNHPALSNRKRFFRECNVEHDYYHALGRASSDPWKKLYYHIEACRLKRFESVLQSANGILALAHQDEQHFQLSFPNVPTYYLPCFHENQQVQSALGNGDFILYHGNLSVAENDCAALYIAEKVAPLLPEIPIVIAGKGTSLRLQQVCSKQGNIRLVNNPTQEQMHELIRAAHIHLMLTFQGTGIKLKLINALYQGRFIVANDSMLVGTPLTSACMIGNTPQQIANQCQELMKQPFTKEDIKKRKKILAPWDIHTLSQQLISILFA